MNTSARIIIKMIITITMINHLVHDWSLTHHENKQNTSNWNTVLATTKPCSSASYIYIDIHVYITSPYFSQIHASWLVQSYSIS